MGSTNFDLSKKGKGSHRKRSGSGRVADWNKINPQLIRSAISCATDSGGALLFGKTSDGGALVVRVYGEGDPYSEYFGPDEDIESWFGAYMADHGYSLGK